MIALSGPRVSVTVGHYHRKMELDAKLFARSHRAIERALARGQQLTRTELATALTTAGISTSGIRLVFLIMQAELSGVICSGPRRGKQFTYMLLEERVARPRAMKRDEAVAELTRRYFTSHGPATIRDFVWWSGLTVRDTRQGLEMNRDTLVQDTVDGLTYWFARSEEHTSELQSLRHLVCRLLL